MITRIPGLRRFLVAGLLLVPAGIAPAASDAAETPAVTTGTHRIRVVSGWTVRVDPRLLERNPEETRRALALLERQLDEIVRVVPADAVKRLREVPLWFSPAYPGVGPRAEYHPDRGWLAAHHRDPAMAKAVEFTNIPEFEAETRRMPNFALHELAHAYHDRVLPGGFDNPDLRRAHARAVASRTYDRVARRDEAGRVHHDRAYALVNPMEFFAENSEAFFSRNDFFPFDRSELAAADPETERLLARLWGVPDSGPPKSGTEKPQPAAP
jgi:dipeptidyl-peptidase-4